MHRGSQDARPREVRIAIGLQAILFLVAFAKIAAAYTLFGEGKEHLAAAAAITLLFAAIWVFLLRGLWSRRNWIRWLTVILNVVGLCAALRNIANDRVLDILACLLIFMRVAATVMFLRPVANQWYGRTGE